MMAKTNGNPAAAHPRTTSPPADQPAASEAVVGVERMPARRSPSIDLRAVLEKSLDRLAQVLPKHMTAERVLHVVTTMVYRTPALQQCDTMSILAAVMQGSALGLDFSPTMGEAYLIPVWNRKIQANECQFRPGYRGLKKLVLRSGAAVDIEADVVHEADVFVYRKTPQLEFLHEPSLGTQRGPVTHAYALAELPSGKYRVAVMNVEELEGIHRRSESYLSVQRKKARGEDALELGPWVTDLNEMFKKTVINRICKSLPMSAEMAEAIDADNRDFEVSGSPGEVRSRVAPRRGMAGLSQRLGLEDQGSPPTPSRVYSEADEPSPDPAGSVDPATVADEAREMSAEDHWPEGRE